MINALSNENLYANNHSTFHNFEAHNGREVK